MNSFCYDIETCGTSSEAIVLSAAIIYFDPEADSDITYDELVNRALYVKFDAKEQAAAKRTVSMDTLKWWAKQGDAIKDMCFKPSPKDLSVAEGLGRINAYVKRHGDKNSFIWARGSLDQMATESLAKQFDVEPFAHFADWMDVRTAVRLLKETSKRSGYCDIPGFDWNRTEKHNPIGDCAIDILLLVQGT